MAQSQQQDYYELLGVSRNASEVEIKKAYKRMAMKYHPDRTKGDKASEEKFKSATQAYEILSDAQKRHAYDQFGHAGVDPSQGRGGSAGEAPFGDIFNDIFSDIFGGNANRRGGHAQPRGADVRYDLELSLEEAVKGAAVTIDVPTWLGCQSCGASGVKKGSKPVSCSTCHGRGQVRIEQGFFSLQQTCPACRGSGQVITDPCQACHGQGRIRDQKKLQVKIPAGVDNGDRIRLSGEGEAGGSRGIAGDLYVDIHLRPHPLFQREGENVHCDVPISFVMAALGGDLEVPTLEGRVKLHIPPETQTGKIFKISGKGVHGVRSRSKGSLLCRVLVETPVDLSRAQKDLLREFEKVTEGQKNSPRVTKWFSRVKDFLNNMKF